MGLLAFTRDSASDIIESNYISTITHDSVTYTIKDAEAQSALAGKQATLVSGTNIKTINNTSLLGSGDISVLQNTAIGTYALTVLGIVSTHDASINIGYRSVVADNYSTAIGAYAGANGNSSIQIGYGANSAANTLSVGFYNNSGTHYNWRLLDGTTGLIPDARLSSNIARTSNVADTTLSNVSSIDANSAVQTALDAKVNKSGDTMTGDLYIVKDTPAIAMQNNNANADYTSTTAPSSDIVFSDLPCSDKNSKVTGGLTTRHNIYNNFATTLYARRSINGSEKSAYFNVYVDSSGNSHCVFPQSDCVDGQWVFSYHEIIANGTINSGSYIEHSLASYLPNDGYNYEILLAVQGNSGGIAGNSVAFNISSDYSGYALYGMAIAKCNTNVNAMAECCGSAVFPIGTGRKIYISNSGSSNASYVYGIIQAYRRIGTNG